MPCVSGHVLEAVNCLTYSVHTTHARIPEQAPPPALHVRRERHHDAGHPAGLDYGFVDGFQDAAPHRLHLGPCESIDWAGLAADELPL